MSHDDTRFGAPGQTACPSDLELARFVEGTLTASARDGMLAHLSECDDCREVVATVVAASPEVAADADEGPAQEPRTWWRQPAAWAALGMAAMVVVALRMGSSPEVVGPPTAAGAQAWTDIAAAVGPERTIEARLTGLPTHVPLASPMRSAAADARFDLQALAGRIADAADAPGADRATRRAARHVAGVAALVAGRAPEAIVLLEAALGDAPAASPARADLLADLSAAHAELAEFAEMSSRDHWAKALQSADDALTLDETHATARFNRALALERLARTDDARRAWQAIAADGALAPGWRDEAAGHARALAP